MNIYFDKESLLEHLSNLEEDNLFKIHLVQEDEHALEDLKRLIEKNIAEKDKEIQEVMANINNLEHSRSIVAAKQQFLEQNMKLKQQGAGGHSIGGYGGVSKAKPDSTARGFSLEHTHSASHNSLD
jgi:hypothetical protein